MDPLNDPKHCYLLIPKVLFHKVYKIKEVCIVIFILPYFITLYNILLYNTLEYLLYFTAIIWSFYFYQKYIDLWSCQLWIVIYFNDKNEYYGWKRKITHETEVSDFELRFLVPVNFISDWDEKCYFITISWLICTDLMNMIHLLRTWSIS